jgi:flavorubredoxin
MAKVNEISADLYRISIYVPDFNLQFNHFLVKDEEPLLFHAGLKGMFPMLREAVAKILDPAKIRWIGFSHFESDECGALNHWLEIAPSAEPVCSTLGAMVSVNDFALRPAKGMMEGEVLETGRHRFRLCRTPHLPHGWDAALLFEEGEKTLFCSDLFHQLGDVEPLTESDLIDRTRQALVEYQAGILADYSPYTANTPRMFDRLAALKPKTFAIMHGSSFSGEGESAVKELAVVFKEILGRE